MLEVRLLPYVPKHEQDYLADTIERWKLDWIGSERRFRRRRDKREFDRRNFKDNRGPYRHLKRNPADGRQRRDEEQLMI